MKKIYILCTLIIIAFAGYTQNFEWAIDFGGTWDCEAKAIAIDGLGNSYTTGYFADTTDFDPGPGIYNLISVGNDDIFVAKTDANGNLVWAIGIGGPDIEEGRAIKIDYTGNIIVAGVFQNTVDFDPGSGVLNLTSSGQYDGFIIKLDTSGNLIWAKTFGGVQSEQIYSIDIDGTGNIYTTGDFRVTVDFDPGPGVYNISTAGIASGIYILKLDSNGNFLWVKATSGQGLITGRSIYVGNSDILVTGNFSTTQDFDFGSGTFSLTSLGNSDIFVLKLKNNGDFVLAFQVGSTSTAGSGERGYAIIEDNQYNIVVTGYFHETADFDPGPSIYNLTSAGNFDMFIAKYDSLGNYVWANSFGNSSMERCFSLSTDASNNIYATGNFFGTVDFDPGSSVHNLVATSGGADIFILKLNSTGNFIWAYNFGTSAMAYGYYISIDAVNNIYVAGNFIGTVDFNPGPGIYNLSTQGSNIDAYILKISQCSPPSLTVGISGNNLCQGDSLVSATVNVNGGTSPYIYNWSNGQTTQTATGLTAGTHTVIVTDDSSCVAIANITITEPSAIVSNITSAPTNFNSPNCNGSVSINPTGGTPPYNVSWSSGTTTNLCEGWYTATIIDANNCIITDSVFVDFQCPSISLSIATTGPPLCYVPTQTFAASAAGGTAPYTFLWSSGDTTSGVNLSLGVYTVTVTDANMCTATLTVTVSSPPPIVSSIASTPTNFNSPNCNGTITINPSGGTPPYNISWSSGTTTNLCEGWYTATITDANGCVETDSVYVDFVTGVEELNLDGISVYPNPVNDVLFINSENEIGEIKIYDVVGKLVKHELIKSNNAEIVVKGFDAGVYFLEAENYRGKFVKR